MEEKSKPQKPKKGFFKKHLLTIAILLTGVSLVAISALVYYFATLYTPSKYENDLVGQRNEIVQQIDTITEDLNQVDVDQDSVSADIQTLQDLNTTFQSKVEATKTPKGRDDLKQENLAFVEQINQYIEAAGNYNKALENDQDYDIKDVIDEYNSSLDKITEQNKKIAEMIQN